MERIRRFIDGHLFDTDKMNVFYDSKCSDRGFQSTRVVIYETTIDRTLKANYSHRGTFIKYKVTGTGLFPTLIRDRSRAIVYVFAQLGSVTSKGIDEVITFEVRDIKTLFNYLEAAGEHLHADSLLQTIELYESWNRENT